MGETLDTYWVSEWIWGNEHCLDWLSLWGKAVILIANSPETPGLQGLRTERGARSQHVHGLLRRSWSRSGSFCLMDTVTWVNHWVPFLQWLPRSRGLRVWRPPSAVTGPAPIAFILCSVYGPTHICFHPFSSTTFFFFFNKMKRALLFSNYKNVTCSY